MLTNSSVRSLKGEEPAVDELTRANLVQSSCGRRGPIDRWLLEETTTEAQYADVWVLAIRVHSAFDPGKLHDVRETDVLPPKSLLLRF